MTPNRAHWGRWGELLGHERILTHNIIVGFGTIAAGGLGVVFQAVISHRLQPADYGAVFAVVSLITLIGLPATAFTLLMARETSRARASGHFAHSTALLRGGNRSLIIAGSGLAVLLLILSQLLTQFLRVPLELLLAASAGIPFSLALPLLLGEFQGEQRFMAFSTLSAGQAALKLIGALGLGAIWGTFGIIAGISLATVAIYFVALGLLRRRLSIKPRLPWMRPAAAYLVIVLPSTLALGVLLSTDVLLVKHFFAGRIAGEYAALAALGRSIFWGASGVAAVLFPKIVFRGTRGQSGKQLVFVSMVLVVIGGLGSLGVLSVGSQWLLTSFAGASYVGVASYLPWYGLGMILLGATAVLIAIHQSRGKPGFLAVLLPLTLLEPTLLLILHQSLTQVVEVVDFSMALLAGSLGALYLVQQRAEHLATAPMPADHATVADLVQAR